MNRMIKSDTPESRPSIGMTEVKGEVYYLSPDLIIPYKNQARRKMDDKELLALYRENGKEHYAFNLIVKAYSERLYWHIRKLVESHDDANDLLQNTLIKA